MPGKKNVSKKKTNETTRPLIQIGGGGTERIEAAQASIVSVLEAVQRCEFGDSVAIEAMKTLDTAAECPSNVNVHGCTFTFTEEDFKDFKKGRDVLR